jgi:hypothetical protein
LFTEDEQTLICRSAGELRLVSMVDGYGVRSMVLGGGQSATVHPDGQWLVADLHEGHWAGVALVDLHEMRLVRRLSSKANDMGAWMAAHAAGQVALTGYRPHEMPNKVEFTEDGRLLVLAVEEGVRAYSWQDVMRANDMLPPAVASADGEIVQIEISWLQNTYGFDIDRGRGLVVFPGLDGRVRALHLESGRATTIVEVPGTPPVTEVVLARDGATLGTLANPGMFSRGSRRSPPLFQIWNLHQPGSASA